MRAAERESRGNVVIILVVLLLIAGALAVGVRLGWVSLKWSVRVVGAPVCQGVNGSGVAFTLETEDVAFAGITIANDGRGVVYRSHANTRSEYNVAGRLLPDNCQAGFDGFCIGEAGKDYTGGGSLDQIWFILAEDGDEDQVHYVHGGVVQELAPGTIGRRPDTCKGGAAEPDTIDLVEALADADGAYALRFEAPHAVTVGAAVRAADAAPALAWRQIGRDITADDGFVVRWHPSEPSEPATIVYTVCWSGNVPGRARGAVDLTPGSVVRTTNTHLSREDLRQAAAIACDDTGGGT